MNPTNPQFTEKAAQRAQARDNDTSFMSRLKTLQSGFDWLLGRAHTLAEGVLPNRADSTDHAWKESLKAEARSGRISPIPQDSTIPEYPVISDADIGKLTPEEAVQLAEQINRLEAHRAKLEKKAPRHRRRESAPGQITDEPAAPTEAYENATALETEASEWFRIRRPPHAGWKDRFLECAGTVATIRTVVGGHQELRFDLITDVAEIVYEEQESSHTPTVVFVGPSNTRLLELRSSSVTSPPDMGFWMKEFHAKKAAGSPSPMRRESLP